MNTESQRPSKERMFEETLDDALRISDRFVAEPVFAATGQGFLRSRGVEGLHEDRDYLVKLANGRAAEDLATNPAAWQARAESLLEPEQFHWLSLSMDERLAALDAAFRDYQLMGGSLEPDPDPQSPFWSREELEAFARSQGASLQITP